MEENVRKLGYEEGEIADRTKSDDEKRRKEEIKKIVREIEHGLKQRRDNPIEENPVEDIMEDYDLEAMKQKLENMVALGYDRAEVIKMMKNLPPIYGSSDDKIEAIKQKLEDMVALGYSRAEGTVSTQELGEQTVQEQKDTELIDGIENAQKKHQKEKESKEQEEK